QHHQLNFDESNPPQPATSPNSGDPNKPDSLHVSRFTSSPPPDSLHVSRLHVSRLTSPPSPVKILPETTPMLNSRLCIALLLFSTLFLISCEKEESAADRRVSENIQASREAYYKKDGGPEKSHKLLESAAKETTASNASKATAKALVGQSNYALAVSRLPEMNAAETEALRVIREINRIGSQLGDE